MPLDPQQEPGSGTEHVVAIINGSSTKPPLPVAASDGALEGDESVGHSARSSFEEDEEDERRRAHNMMDIVVVQREEMDEEEEESSRGWVYQYDAVSTRGHRHRVAVRVLHGHDTDELNRLVVVDRQVFGSSSWSLKCFARYIRRMHGAGFVAEINGEVAGFVLHIATSKRGVAEVANVGVLEEFRQMGIASTLLRLALDDLASRGYHTVKLHVASQNVAAQSLYLKMGFVQTGYKEDYYWQDQDRDAVVMRLQLLPLLPETEVSCSFL